MLFSSSIVFPRNVFCFFVVSIFYLCKIFRFCITFFSSQFFLVLNVRLFFLAERFSSQSCSSGVFFFLCALLLFLGVALFFLIFGFCFFPPWGEKKGTKQLSRGGKRGKSPEEQD